MTKAAGRTRSTKHEKKMRKRRPGIVKPRIATSQEVAPPRNVTDSAAVSKSESRPRTQRAVPALTYVRNDLFRVGIVAGVTLLVLIVLRLVL